MVEFIEELNLITDRLKKECNGSISVVSGCELFMRFVTRVASDSTEVFGCAVCSAYALSCLGFESIQEETD